MNPREIAVTHPAPQRAEIVLYLDPDLFWFRGHFPAQAVLPGVAQLDWVMHYAQQTLVADYQFHSIRQVKFQAPLLPGHQITLVLEWLPQSQILSFIYQRHIAEQRHTATSGKIHLCR